MEPHFIIMSSSYTNGVRISLDIVKESQLREKYITGLICKIRKECGKDVSLSTHCILTQDKSWESVVKTDKFFKTVRLISTVDDFIREINKDRILKKEDVARYISSKIVTSKLDLENIIKDCFNLYFKIRKKKLFEDEECKYNFKRKIDDQLELALRSRILFAEDGLKKLFCIDYVLKNIEI